MNSSQIFKLIFKHDLRLNELADNNAASTPKDAEASILDFMKPDPTYSRLHFSGTDLETEEFGINTLTEYASIIEAIERGLNAHSYSANNEIYSTFMEAVQSIDVNQGVFISPTENATKQLPSIHNEEDFGLKFLLENEFIVVHKVAAPTGFDLVLYSQDNVYFDLFPHLQNLVPDAFRFFSINGKKFNTERHFYFETWTLARPPHGFEEVFPETVI
ncbi:MAG: hypothetical protein WC967_03160 [Balneolaceae bacterium]